MSTKTNPARSWASQKQKTGKKKQKNKQTNKPYYMLRLKSHHSDLDIAPYFDLCFSPSWNEASFTSSITVCSTPCLPENTFSFLVFHNIHIASITTACMTFLIFRILCKSNNSDNHSATVLSVFTIGIFNQSVIASHTRLAKLHSMSICCAVSSVAPHVLHNTSVNHDWIIGTSLMWAYKDKKIWAGYCY
ncbi:hypothetical protein HanHA89_Chr04g0127581 [Helianthus annuus]|nr:hypothetical protein HanHA89_Chr04g0127581 [Helianthus annuus]